MSSIYNINLNIDKEYIPAINDLIRMFIIQVVVNFMFSNKDISQARRLYDSQIRVGEHSTHHTEGQGDLGGFLRRW
jgi:hypothetical protein